MWRLLFNVKNTGKGIVPEMENRTFRALLCGFCGLVFLAGGLLMAATLLEQGGYLAAVIGAVMLLCAAVILTDHRKERCILLCAVAGAELFLLGIFLEWMNTSAGLVLLVGAVLMFGAVLVGNMK
jgi:hypothetical protein